MGAVKPRWWRRNAIALVALAVLVPATGGAIAWQEWRTYYEFRHWQHIPVAAGASIELDGVDIGPASLVEVPAEVDVDVPPGARALAAQLTLVPGDEPLSCARPLLVERGTGRSWEGSWGPLGWEGEVSCYEATEPVFLNLLYLVPEDAGPFELEVAILGSEPSLPTFVLELP
ncbi:hypothetical protein AA0Z99_11990 [Agrococcus sp. 1P02AA]|uniref:hypothetical protein n=1 Tax=Agrococcus sp. 1P02AA TaxID=3132259 RepID=UPI0039A734FF